MNHTHEHTHVSCHDYSHSFHHKTLFFSPCCKPCKLLCCTQHNNLHVLHRFTYMLCRFELFFVYLSVTVLSLAYLFLNYFCYVYIQIHSLYFFLFFFLNLNTTNAEVYNHSNINVNLIHYRGMHYIVFSLCLVLHVQVTLPSIL